MSGGREYTRSGELTELAAIVAGISGINQLQLQSLETVKKVSELQYVAQVLAWAMGQGVFASLEENRDEAVNLKFRADIQEVVNVELTIPLPNGVTVSLTGGSHIALLRIIDDQDSLNLEASTGWQVVPPKDKESSDEE